MGFETRSDLPQPPQEEFNGDKGFFIVVLVLIGVGVLCAGTPDLLDAIIKRVGGY